MNPYLAKISEEVESGKSPPPVTTREFLSWFEAQRRGYWIVRHIRRELEESRLQTIPDFESNYIDAHLQLIRMENEEDQTLTQQDQVVETADVETVETRVDLQTTTPDWVRRDPTYRISKLAPANQYVVSVTPDGTLAEVIALLLLKNFSQLPVMTNEREVKGVITWT